MKALYLILSVVGNFHMGSSIKCILNGSPDKLCAPTATGAVATCAIRENKDINKGTQTFCGSEPVGCVEETEGTTCYCDQNNCNTNMVAGGLKSEASTGAGGLPGGDGGQASLKVSLVISLVGSILPVILNKLW